MKHIGSNWVEFNSYFWGLDQSGNKVEFHYTTQTSDYARTRLLRDNGRSAYYKMLREENIKPMHIEVDGEVLYHVGKKDGGEGRKVCRI